MPHRLVAPALALGLIACAPAPDRGAALPETPPAAVPAPPIEEDRAREACVRAALALGLDVLRFEAVDGAAAEMVVADGAGAERRARCDHGGGAARVAAL